MSVDGHENNGFAHPPEQGSGAANSFVSRISQYTVSGSGFEKEGLIANRDYSLDMPSDSGLVWPRDYFGLIKGLDDRSTDSGPKSLHEIWAKAPASDFIIEETTPTIYTAVQTPEAATIEESEDSPVRQSALESKPSRRLKLSQGLGVLIAAASLRVSLLEPGKKLNAIKDEISQAGRKANLAFGTSLNIVSEGLEKASKHRKPIGLVLGSIALAGMAYTAYKTGINPFSSSGRVAEKTNHANSLMSLSAPTKVPSAEHAESFQQLSGVTKPQYHETLATATTVAQHKPNTDININDLTWNVAHQKAAGHETQLINDALKSYGHGAHLVGSNSQIQLGNGKIVNFQQMREINQLIVKARS